MVIGIYLWAQILVAALSAINIVKLMMEYKEKSSSVTLFLVGFCILNIILAVSHFTILFLGIQGEIAFGFTGRTLMNMILLLMTGYLLTVTLYFLEYKKFYIFPFLAAIIFFLLGIIIPGDLYDTIRTIALVCFALPSIILFFYVANKKSDRRSFSFAIFLIIESVMGIILLRLPDVSGILHIIGNVILFLGVLGVFDNIGVSADEEVNWADKYL